MIEELKKIEKWLTEAASQSRTPEVRFELIASYSHLNNAISYLSASTMQPRPKRGRPRKSR